MRRLKTKWALQRKGIRIEGDNAALLQSLRFADDLLLIAKSNKDVTHMLRDLIEESAKFGLEVHMGKTKVLNNSIGINTQPGEIELSSGHVEVLGRGQSTMYLGRALNLRACQDTEIQDQESMGEVRLIQKRIH